jgi:hypothetical protein
VVGLLSDKLSDGVSDERAPVYDPGEDMLELERPMPALMVLVLDNG